MLIKFEVNIHDNQRMNPDVFGVFPDLYCNATIQSKSGQLYVQNILM